MWCHNKCLFINCVLQSISAFYRPTLKGGKLKVVLQLTQTKVRLRFYVLLLSDEQHGVGCLSFVSMRSEQNWSRRQCGEERALFFVCLFGFSAESLRCYFSRQKLWCVYLFDLFRSCWGGLVRKDSRVCFGQIWILTDEVLLQFTQFMLCEVAFDFTCKPARNMWLFIWAFTIWDTDQSGLWLRM